MSFSPHQRSPGRRSPLQEELCTGSPCSSVGSWLHCEQLASHILHSQVWSGSMDPFESFRNSWPALPVRNYRSGDQFTWLQSHLSLETHLRAFLSVESFRLWVRRVHNFQKGSLVRIIRLVNCPGALKDHRVLIILFISDCTTKHLPITTFQACGLSVVKSVQDNQQDYLICNKTPKALQWHEKQSR